MSEQAGLKGQVDAVQIFDAAEAIAGGLTELATSPNSHISVIQVPARGEAQLDPRGLDQILIVMKGQCVVQTTTGTHALQENQGVLIPPGVHSRLSNSTDEEAVVFSME